MNRRFSFSVHPLDESHPYWCIITTRQVECNSLVEVFLTQGPKFSCSLTHREPWVTLWRNNSSYSALDINFKLETEEEENTTPAAFKVWKHRFIPVSLRNYFHVTLMASQKAEPLGAWRQFHPVCFLLSPFLTLHTFTPSLIFTFVKTTHTHAHAHTQTDTHRKADKYSHTTDHWVFSIKTLCTYVFYLHRVCSHPLSVCLFVCGLWKNYWAYFHSSYWKDELIASRCRSRNIARRSSGDLWHFQWFWILIFKIGAYLFDWYLSVCSFIELKGLCGDMSSTVCDSGSSLEENPQHFLT